MPNPFNSDYVSIQATQAVPAAAPAQQAVTMATGKTPSESIDGIAPTASGFEPERYGLGKPRRVVTRGKIAVG